MGWATFWATFLQTHLVTLCASRPHQRRRYTCILGSRKTYQTTTMNVNYQMAIKCANIFQFKALQNLPILAFLVSKYIYRYMYHLATLLGRHIGLSHLTGYRPSRLPRQLDYMNVRSVKIKIKLYVMFNHGKHLSN
jgi:hypothetical protein